MKRIIKLTALLYAVLLIAGSGDAFSTEAGNIVTVKKDVYVINGDSRVKAEVRHPLVKGDAVETGKASRAKILFADDSILSLGEMSRVEVDEYLADSSKDRSKSIYDLIDGSMRVVVGRSDLEIHTPTAVAAARGTSFQIWSEGEGRRLRTCSKVYGGQVKFRNKDGEIKGFVTAKKGDTCCVPLGGMPRLNPPGLPEPPPIKPPITKPENRPQLKQGDFERIDNNGGGEG